MVSLMHHLLRRGVRGHPDKEAVVQGNRRWTYARFDEASERLAGALVRAGLQPIDRVGIFLEKGIEEALSIFSVSKAGGVFVPINHLLFPEQVRHILSDCRPRALITTRDRLASLEHVLAVVPSVEIVVLVDGEGAVHGGYRVLEMRDILATAPPGPVTDRCISKDLGAILYTSGSTGRPKGVMFSQANLVAGSRIVSSYLEITESEPIGLLLEPPLHPGFVLAQVGDGRYDTGNDVGHL